MMQPHKIAILSDTHGLLRPEVRDALEDCEHILHAGDIADRKTYDDIACIAPATFVRGNADKDWAEFIPKEQEIVLFGINIYVLHNKKYMQKNLSGTDIVIYGHSHKYEDYEENGIRFLNPGSCGPRRFHQPVTMMIMMVDERNHEVSIDKADFSPILNTGETKLPQKDMDRLLKVIMKDMDANRSVEDIARRNRVDEDFTQQILQIYTTHPGIDAEGILNRMDILGR